MDERLAAFENRAGTGLFALEGQVCGPFHFLGRRRSSRTPLAIVRS
ncbi:hypothetical protein ABT404_39055 [Streptomyces hyaluromycini]|uniref:Uncharacterized protein n=1 Tax=Streptomyces hyaluromycini TaxID=1377993 RepID=A0ABV1X8N7_9ACTN